MDEEERDKPWNFHTCKSCSYRSKSAFQMCKHVQFHQRRSKTDTFICDLETLETFECEFCGFETNLRVDLTEHFRVFHEEKEENEEIANIWKCYPCKRCGFNTHSLLVLTQHVDLCNTLPKNNSGHEVDDLSASKNGTFKAKYNLRLKRYIARREPDLENLKPKDIDRFKCGQCPYKAKRIRTFRMHISRKHSNPEIIKWFICHQCAYKTKDKGDLRRHIVSKHTNPEDISWFKCNQCAYKSKRKAGLTKHVLHLHTNPENINWFKCSQCTYKSKRNEGLRRHILNRHTDPENISWFKCSQCAYESKGKDNLRRHISCEHSSS